MTINEYQKLAQRTANTKRPSDKLENACLWLAGETGEVCDILKKYLFQGHELDRPHLIEEAGDCAWYLAELAAALGVSLETILDRNIAKLEKRYPDGFDAERSRHRPDENQA
nr:MAG TPA: NTP-PPase-like protein [Bacteriophage sp.]